MSDLPLIEVSELSKIKTNSNEHFFFGSLSFNILPAKVTSLHFPLIKESHAMVQSIAGLTNVVDGNIYFRSKNTPVIIPEELITLGWLTVSEGIKLINPDIENDSLQRLIEMTGLTGFEHYYPKAGNNEFNLRIALANALATEKEVMICENPFGYIGEEFISELKEIFRIIKTTGRAVILTCENRIIAQKLSDEFISFSGKPLQINERFTAA